MVKKSARTAFLFTHRSSGTSLSRVQLMLQLLIVIVALFITFFFWLSFFSLMALSRSKENFDLFFIFLFYFGLTMFTSLWLNTFRKSSHIFFTIFIFRVHMFAGHTHTHTEQHVFCFWIWLFHFVSSLITRFHIVSYQSCSLRFSFCVLFSFSFFSPLLFSVQFNEKKTDEQHNVWWICKEKL